MKLIFVTACLLIAASSFGQTNDQVTSYHSEADELVTIDKVSYAPFLDNLNGIYARPLEAHFAQVLSEMHRWSASSGTVNTGNLSLEDLEADPNHVKEIAAGSGDAFFAAKIIKGPKGINLKLDLFLSKDGRLLLQDEIKNYQQFEMSLLKDQLDLLITHIVHKLPYSGRVMSRDVNRVTLNVGSRDGLQAGQVLSVIQIIKLNRHPKFSFIVTTEKEIIGKIKVLKVDDTLSFGSIVMEKQKGSVEKGSKLDSLEFISYAINEPTLTPGGDESLQGRPDAHVAFGKDAKAWKPQDEPSIGQVGARLGWSFFNEARDITTGGVSSHDNLTPLVMLDGELWLTSSWTVHAGIKESIFSVSNPLSGSSPSTISETLSAYELLVGYRFRFGPTPWSPYAEPFLGYMTYRLYADGTTPTAYTTMDYSGIKLGLQGATPVFGDWSAGGIIAFVIMPSLSESPGSSGTSSSSNINQFGVWGSKKLTEHWKAQGNLDFEFYSSSFSGTGSANTANTASQKWMTLSGGVYYMF